MAEKQYGINTAPGSVLYDDSDEVTWVIFSHSNSEYFLYFQGEIDLLGALGDAS